MKRPPKIKNDELKTTYKTLLIDGNSLFKRGYHGAKDEFNRDGNHIGGIYQFITMIRKMLVENIYHRVFVFWDGEFSGKLRYNIYPEYKIGRGKDYINGTKPDDENQLIETYIIQGILDDLFIKQMKNNLGEEEEADDCIAFYCKTKEENERITIVTNDRDLCQLINETVDVYILNKKIYVNNDNFQEIFSYHKDNILLIKTICGDVSDSIRGVKGLGEKSLFKFFPNIKKSRVYLHQIIESAKLIQEERILNKKKPIKSLSNLLNGVTTNYEGDEIILGEDLYKRNDQLVDLSKPLIKDSTIKKLNNLKRQQLDSENRGIKEVIKKIKDFGLDKKIVLDNDEFLLPFKKLMEREKRMLND